jgi:hypothetical protein
MNYMGVLVLKKFENGFQKIKLSRDSINDSVNSSNKKREGEITQNKASNNPDLITSNYSRRTKGKTSESPSLTESPFFCCEKYYLVDKLSSPLD